MRDRLNQLKSKVPGFQARAGQNKMFAEVAKTIFGAYQINSSSLRSLVVEGQTGSGKSIGYLLPAIEAIQFFNKSKKADADKLQVVVATANVSLQQQLISSDLPILRKAGVNISSKIVVGKNRYFCVREAMAIAANNTQTSMIESPQPSFSSYAEKMLESFQDNRWSGVKDDLSFDIPESLWPVVSFNKHTCTNYSCEHADECPLLRDRKESKSADILITNHALLTADAALRSQGVPNTILPTPERSILICDEAHHLPETYRSNQKLNVSINDLIKSVKNAGKLRKSLLLLGEGSLGQGVFSSLQTLKPVLPRLAEQMYRLFDEKTSSTTHRFPRGFCPQELSSVIQQEIVPKLSDALKLIDAFMDNLSSEDKTSFTKGDLHSHFITLNQAQSLLQNSVRCLKAIATNENLEPSAKWIERTTKPNDLFFYYSLINVSEDINTTIVNSYHTTIFASATIRCLGTFTRFAQQMGFKKDDGSVYLLIKSPFNYAKSTLKLYPSFSSPSDEQSHTDHILKEVNNEMDEHDSGLLLFSSRRQMNLFISTMPEELLSIAKMQYTKPRAALVQEHRESIDNGKKSLLIGVQSFSEGLDLPGRYLTLVCIAKIPFGDHINDPILASESEHFQAAGKHPFSALSLPDASKRLIQSVGRLVRSLNCSGTVAIYDPRLITKSYGTQLIQALPDMMQRRVST